jgi:hypothetical protein
MAPVLDLAAMYASVCKLSATRSYLRALLLRRQAP